MTTITREQFEAVRPLFENARKKTRPRQHDLYAIFSAVLHYETTGCAWRHLPPGSPPWRSCHEYRTHWSKPAADGGKSVLAQAYATLGIEP